MRAPFWRRLKAWPGVGGEGEGAGGDNTGLQSCRSRDAGQSRKREGKPARPHASPSTSVTCPAGVAQGQSPPAAGLGPDHLPSGGRVVWRFFRVHKPLAGQGGADRAAHRGQDAGWAGGLASSTGGHVCHPYPADGRGGVPLSPLPAPNRGHGPRARSRQSPSPGADIMRQDVTARTVNEPRQAVMYPYGGCLWHAAPNPDGGGLLAAEKHPSRALPLQTVLLTPCCLLIPSLVTRPFVVKGGGLPRWGPANGGRGCRVHQGGTPHAPVDRPGAVAQAKTQPGQGFDPHPPFPASSQTAA